MGDDPEQGDQGANSGLNKLRGAASSASLDGDQTAVGQEPDPEFIGNYRVLGRLGEGGFGKVFLAEQTEPIRRQVALKVLHEGMNSQEVLARFEAERQLLALMDHRGISRVLDAGVTSTGSPFFVMEVVDGIPITDYCNEARLGLEARLQLFEQVCQAVQHAHQKGVIHRDLKPSNILVTEESGEAFPVVIDFGIAKAVDQDATEEVALTRSFQILGTPEYMSPEQAAGKGAGVDTRADVYALGLLLYELVTGTKAFDIGALWKLGYMEVLRTIREEDPPRPSTRVSSLGEDSLAVGSIQQLAPRQLSRRLRGDLDCIVMMALEKERERRYSGVGEFAADVRHYRKNEPVSATPPSASYRLRKLVRRHRGGVAALATILVLLIAGSTGTGIGFVRASDQAQRAGKEAARYERIAGLMTDMLTGIGPSVALGRDTTLLKEAVDRMRQQVDADFATPGSASDREVECTIRGVLGQTYNTIGEFDLARENIQRALDLSVESYGKRSLTTATLIYELANVDYEQGQFERVLELLPAAIEVLVNELGERGQDALFARITLASSHRELGNLETAKDIFAGAIEDARQAGPKGQLALVTATTNLAKVHDSLDERAQALQRSLEALELDRALNAGDHPSVAKNLVGVGRSYLQLGDKQRAEPFLVEGLAMSRRIFEPGHSSLAAQVHNLARFYGQQGRYAEAEPLYREVLASDCQGPPIGSHFSSAKGSHPLAPSPTAGAPCTAKHSHPADRAPTA